MADVFAVANAFGDTTVLGVGISKLSIKPKAVLSAVADPPQTTLTDTPIPASETLQDVSDPDQTTLNDLPEPIPLPIA